MRKFLCAALLAALMLPFAGCKKDGPGTTDTEVKLPASLSVSGPGIEGGDAVRAMAPDGNGAWDIYGNFTAGSNILVDGPGEFTGYLSVKVPDAKAGLGRLRVDVKAGTWEIVHINKVQLVVTEGGSGNPKEGAKPPIEAVYEGAGVWKVERLYVENDHIRYRYELDTDNPASLKYWVASWDNSGSAPSELTADYLKVRALGQADYEALMLKANRACWMFPAEAVKMLADFSISMNAAVPVQEVELTPAHKGPDAVFIGDSITWQWNRASRTDAKSNLVYLPNPLPSWMTESGDNIVTRFHPQFFSEHGYLDKGVSGETTAQMLSHYKVDAIDTDPHCVVIMGGTNDLAHGTSEAKILDIIADMAEQAVAAGIKVILCSVTPCNRAYSALSNPNTKGEHILALNELIKKYAASMGFEYCDYHSALVGPDGLAMDQRFWLYDDLHPNPDAYTIMEGIIVPIINKVLKKNQ